MANFMLALRFGGFMILAMFFALAALLHALLFASTIRLNTGVAVWLLRLLLVGLFVDNTILALSPIVFNLDIYYSVSGLRYLVHVLVLPPLVVAGTALAVQAGVAWAARPAIVVAAIMFALVTIVVGVVTELAGLELVRETLFGHDRYVSAHASPPVATIVTNVFMLAIAATIGRASGYWIPFAGTLIIFVVNGAFGSSDWGIVAGNLAEVLFAGSWVLALHRFNAN